MFSCETLASVYISAGRLSDILVIECLSPKKRIKFRFSDSTEKC